MSDCSDRSVPGKYESYSSEKNGVALHNLEGFEGGCVHVCRAERGRVSLDALKCHDLRLNCLPRIDWICWESLGSVEYLTDIMESLSVEGSMTDYTNYVVMTLL